MAFLLVKVQIPGISAAELRKEIEADRDKKESWFSKADHPAMVMVDEAYLQRSKADDSFFALELVGVVEKTDAVAQLEELADAATTKWPLFYDSEKIGARYVDRDLSDGVPRTIMYFDIGVLCGTIKKLQEELKDLQEARDS